MDLYQGLFELFGGVVAFSALVYVTLVVVVRIEGGSLSGGLKRIVQLMIWLVTAVQIVSAVARSEEEDRARTHNFWHHGRVRPFPPRSAAPRSFQPVHPQPPAGGLPCRVAHPAAGACVMREG